MSDTLRDQLLGLGFKPAPRASQPPKSGQSERRPEGARKDKSAHPAGQPRHPAKGKPAQAGKSRPTAGRPAAANKPATNRPDINRPDINRPDINRPARSREEIDLAKAYAIRAQREKDERIEAERVKQEEARLRREAKATLETLLKDKSLNDAAADIARHFPYGGKIKRIYVTADQLKALNAGELGVLQQNGRYLLVTSALLAEAEAIFPPCVALKVDPDAPAEEDPYADPQYQVPDDLVW